MNSLLPPGTGNLHTQVKVQKVRAREFPISAVRFVHEMGDGVFGKVYRGELGGIVGGVTSLVAVKTLKPGATQQTRTDFQVGSSGPNETDDSLCSLCSQESWSDYL